MTLRIPRLATFALLIAALVSASPMKARADDYPSKPIKLLVGASPGGTTDTMARAIAQPLSVSLDAQSLTTPVSLRMLRVGERTGMMGEMMERAAAFHEEELARWVERFTRTFEPLLMAVIGVVIGGIVVLMYFPIFELAGSVH